MISLADREALLAALAKPLPAELHSILTNIVAHTAETNLLDLTYIVVAEPGDTEQGIAAEIGFSPLTNPIDGIRWDEPNFHPYWPCLRLRGGWYELTHAIETGFAIILLIDATADTDLLAMCEHFMAVPL